MMHPVGWLAAREQTGGPKSWRSLRGQTRFQDRKSAILYLTSTSGPSRSRHATWLPDGSRAQLGGRRLVKETPENYGAQGWN